MVTIVQNTSRCKGTVKNHSLSWVCWTSDLIYAHLDFYSKGSLGRPGVSARHRHMCSFFPVLIVAPALSPLSCKYLGTSLQRSVLTAVWHNLESFGKGVSVRDFMDQVSLWAIIFIVLIDVGIGSPLGGTTPWIWVLHFVKVEKVGEWQVWQVWVLPLLSTPCLGFPQMTDWNVELWVNPFPLSCCLLRSFKTLERGNRREDLLGKLRAGGGMEGD